MSESTVRSDRIRELSNQLKKVTKLLDVCRAKAPSLEVPYQDPGLSYLSYLTVCKPEDLCYEGVMRTIVSGLEDQERVILKKLLDLTNQ